MCCAFISECSETNGIIFNKNGNTGVSKVCYYNLKMTSASFIGDLTSGVVKS